MQTYTLEQYTTKTGASYRHIPLSYQCFGLPLGQAPVILVNHALTGNSNVAGPDGWWSDLIGRGKTIDLNHYSVLAVNVPGNGYDGFLIEKYQDFTPQDIAQLFCQLLDVLNIKRLYALIGCSLGGGIAWEMACLRPKLTQYLIPVAANCQSSLWLQGHCQVQQRILLHSNHPIEDARQMAMLFYRAPQSFEQKKSARQGQAFSATAWLDYHGRQLNKRFDRRAYLLMNCLLGAVHIDLNRQQLQSKLKAIEATVISIAIESDFLVTAAEIYTTHQWLKNLGVDSYYHSINSAQGHDAFLIEHQQVSDILQTLFKINVYENY